VALNIRDHALSSNWTLFVLFLLLGYAPSSSDMGGVLAGYESDVFISYRRNGNVPQWVHNHFLPKLRSCLSDEVEDGVTVFVDHDVDVGANWPMRLEKALLGTKMLVAVWSAQYFRSTWCLTEWASMVAREERLGLGSARHPEGLVYPILFADSENFPPSVLSRSYRDLKKWNCPDRSFQDTAEYVEFHREMQKIARELAERLATVPEWQPDWPIARPTVDAAPPTLLPQLGPS
jgi:hypothetical protein